MRDQCPNALALSVIHYGELADIGLHIASEVEIMTDRNEAHQLIRRIHCDNDGASVANGRNLTLRTG